jgi:hypothetical protein
VEFRLSGRRGIPRLARGDIMKVGDLVRSVSRKNDLALVMGFKEVYEGCGNNYPIIMWLENNQIDSCNQSRVEVISESQ